MLLARDEVEAIPRNRHCEGSSIVLQGINGCCLVCKEGTSPALPDQLAYVYLSQEIAIAPELESWMLQNTERPRAAILLKRRRGA